MKLMALCNYLASMYLFAVYLKNIKVKKTETKAKCSANFSRATSRLEMLQRSEAQLSESLAPLSIMGAELKAQLKFHPKPLEYRCTITLRGSRRASIGPQFCQATADVLFSSLVQPA